MKKVLVLLLSFILTFALVSCGESSEGDVIELSFAGQDAEGLPTTEAMYWIAEQVEERTNGEVVISVYPASQMGEAKLIYQGIMDGSVDMMMSYLDSTYNPLFDLTTVPFLATEISQLEYIYSEESNVYKIYEESMEETNMGFMGFYLNGVNGLFGTEDPGNYKDISVKKDNLVRIASSELYKITVEGLGYNTITVPWTDTYTSMQTGIFDSMTGIPSYMVVQNFGDVVKHYLPLNMIAETQVIAISPKTRDSLSEEHLNILTEVCQEATLRSLEESEENVLNGEKELEELGVEIHPLTSEERAKIAEDLHEVILPSVAEIFGQDIMDQLMEDVEATKNIE